MLQRKILNKENCAVSFGPTEIMIRKRGKVNYGTEKTLAEIKDNKLYIDINVAKEYGVEVVINE